MSNLESVANLQIKTQFEVKVNVGGNRLDVDLTSVWGGSVIKSKKEIRGYVQQVKQGKGEIQLVVEEKAMSRLGAICKKTKKGGNKKKHKNKNQVHMCAVPRSGSVQLMASLPPKSSDIVYKKFESQGTSVGTSAL